MSKTSICIDESGTLPDPKSLVVIVAAVSTQRLSTLKAIPAQVKKTLKLTNTSEIKFYRSGDRTKQKFLATLAQTDCRIFVLVVTKQGKSIPDTPENFAVLCGWLVRSCLANLPPQPLEFVFDRHFHRRLDQTAFNRHLAQICGQPLSIKHLDSQAHPEINAADMVAGSVLWTQTHKNSRFYTLIQKRIVVQKIISWSKLKQHYWQQKTRPNRRKRPSETS